MSAPQKQSFVQLACSRGLSQRRACGLCRLPRSTCRYHRRPKRSDEAVLVERLQQFARRRRRRGYRLAHQELRRDGFAVNHKRIYRLWKEHRLTVPARHSRKKRRSGAFVSEVMARAPRQVWCLDFLEERTFAGGRVRVLCISDEFTRQSLARVAGHSFRSERVCEVLDTLCSQLGTPKMLRMDNGPEFIALALRGLSHRRGMELGFIAPGKPWQNGFAESFHARLRDEFLDGEVFLTVREAQVRLDVWRRYWNEERLHSSLAYVPPDEFAQSWVESSHEETENVLRSLALTGT